ncbi:TPA: phosphatidylserine decarboxylase [Legionella pneumophila subsp. pneumophila]|uniref:Phosphatidylserine decarboxylase proenzyme n=1 Tax=Legionella pneumophila (strain Lens) TaxID=297245 RepID=PSD_LEGPL|nr:archaetidylserine decarboxylase [Legionella pneumophila]Q5WSH5.1 RecName: Full=Phosphatidylserine decarboxylase proenzyme; Contains: RecName: Full=Phosphatidylserine decarboxylase alpha chain; Contains: RecName: Full=Phosphatidylserine decarboxylase beta chain [Legionella pneumophila str. Lens]MDW9166855.1 archaetidylserine decarboxylase [Legionella pneumophila subsp. fraseri]AOW53284.1 phosphatidylserine decarboxylase [Legionella pneumophila subsp. pneumophila]AOW55817.1 phosphatidylserine 
MFRDVLKTLPQYLIPKHGITALAGYFADVKNPRLKNFLIRNFIRKFDVDMSEALIEDPKSYDCFNDFFIRHLKPECRPLSQSDVICPVDGCISEIGKIERGQLLQAKGKYYSVQELLACDGQLAEQFVQGQFATLYLSPKDYHRVHMPIDAELVSMTYIPGALFSVQPATTRVVPKLFARNERLAIFFKTKIGPMVMVMVGATIVGAIGTSWHGDVKRSKKLERFDYSEQFSDKIISQGSEMGYFKLGSTVVLLFANGEKIQWDKELLAGSKIQLGKPMAIIT